MLNYGASLIVCCTLCVCCLALAIFGSVYDSYLYAVCIQIMLGKAGAFVYLCNLLEPHSKYTVSVILEYLTVL